MVIEIEITTPVSKEVPAPGRAGHPHLASLKSIAIMLAVTSTLAHLALGGAEYLGWQRTPVPYALGTVAFSCAGFFMLGLSHTARDRFSQDRRAAGTIVAAYKDLPYMIEVERERALHVLAHLARWLYHFLNRDDIVVRRHGAVIDEAQPLNAELMPYLQWSGITNAIQSQLHSRRRDIVDAVDGIARRRHKTTPTWLYWVNDGLICAGLFLIILSAVTEPSLTGLVIFLAAVVLGYGFKTVLDGSREMDSGIGYNEQDISPPECLGECLRDVHAACERYGIEEANRPWSKTL